MRVRPQGPNYIIKIINTYVFPMLHNKMNFAKQIVNKINIFKGKSVTKTYSGYALDNDDDSGRCPTIFIHKSLRPYLMLFFLWFPLCRDEADLLVTAKYGYFF